MRMKLNLAPQVIEKVYIYIIYIYIYDVDLSYVLRNPMIVY